MGKELNDDNLYSTTLKDKKVPRTANRVQHWLRGENGSPLKRSETHVLSTNGTNLLKKQIHLEPALLGGNLSYVNIFVGSYRAFATTQEVLDLLFARSAPCA
ncbi:ral guanine nucleotide dissociation stimulator-like [Lutra lutra]|uniref:ral guanine nucleotide dissociation stimulator-like n=1 Tax=Lutra lutra TaxID=9657 RepID=UPI001FD1FF56|nr:ral guanine nucleotide dissociation stimulator-like [Lutra lutra]